MNGLSAQDRGDLAERMLVDAARLATIVRGEGTAEDVAEITSQLDRQQMDALVVVLAGLVDPDRPLGALLCWMEFDEHGKAAKPDLADRRTLRTIAEEWEESLDVPAEADLVDEVAVMAYSEGRPVEVTDEERLLAVIRCVSVRGMTYEQIDHMQRLTVKTTKRFVERMRTAYERHGREFPDFCRADSAARFSEEQVVEIRERSAAGTPDRVLAVEFDSTLEVIGAICRGRRYAQYGGPVRGPRSGPSEKSRKHWADGYYQFPDQRAS
ncbi:hypothetical protein [Streptomyces cinereoruber]|uniref:hypothetical protein n=1 Tax=Streptomyces cinereoruber TaxID=67260 RepID=UPI00362FD81C